MYSKILKNGMVYYVKAGSTSIDVSDTSSLEKISDFIIDTKENSLIKAMHLGNSTNRANMETVLDQMIIPRYTQHKR